jgi:hypothetical protein
MVCAFSRVSDRKRNKLVQTGRDYLEICLDKCVHNPEMFVRGMFMGWGVTILYAKNYIYKKLYVFVFVVWINEQEMEVYIMWI